MAGNRVRQKTFSPNDVFCGLDELNGVSDRPYYQTFHDRRKTDLGVFVFVAVVECWNWEEMGERMAFVRSVRNDVGGSDDAKIEYAIEI